MTGPDHDRRAAGAPPGTIGAATTTHRRRRRPWAWLVPVLVGVVVVVVVLLFATRCGGANPSGAPTTTAPILPTTAPAVPTTTPTGGAADVAGVSARIGQLLAASPITFRGDSADLTDADARTVDQVARELAAVPTARVTVTGYTAPVSRGVGPDAQELSDRRAATVADRLVAGGVGADRLQTRGAGASNPLPSTAASRRADITVS
ncbi:OmpA family protein [Actinomycetospora sp. CA-084318]|uniref:OmpA family protein n=1 Tax=Actinomycetospora sp. CA-084318 TaxID=3239892 RepID=UPI003D966AB1